MKKLLIALLCLSFIGLAACEQMTDMTDEDPRISRPATNDLPSEYAPFFYVIEAYAALIQSPRWAERLGNMDEEQRKSEFVRNFEMLQEEAFLSFETYRLDDRRFLYAFYVANDGTRVLLLNGGGILDIYTIQNGIAVQQKSFYFDRERSDFGPEVSLQKNGNIVHVGSDYRFYRFENGVLKHLATLTGRPGVGYIYVRTNGSEIPISQEERHQLLLEYLGDGWERAQLDWHPLAEFGR